MTDSLPRQRPAWIETDFLTGIHYTDSDSAQAPVERLPECPLPKELDAFLACSLANGELSIALQDAGLRYVYVANQHHVFRSHAILGKVQEEVPYYPKNRPSIVAIKRRVMQTGVPETVEGWFDTMGDESYFLRLEFSPFPFPDGSTGLMNRITDLTEVRRAAKTQGAVKEYLEDKMRDLSRKNQILTTLLKEEGSIYNLVDEDMRYILSLNYEAMGHTHEQTVGKSLLETPGMPKADAEYAYNLMKSVLETGVPFEGEGWFEVREGMRRYSKFRYTQVQLPNGRLGVLSIARDMTREKMAELSLTSTNALLAAANLNLEKMNGQLTQVVQELEEKTRLLNQQMEEAKVLQLTMLPKANPLPERFTIAASMETSEHVGGDYYDYMKTGRNGLVLAVGDATGHGLRSSIVVTAVRSFFQTWGGRPKPGKLLSMISEGIERMNMERIFMGLAVLRFDGRQFSFASAGMPPVFWYKAATQEVEVIETRTIFLGTSIVREFPELSLDIQPGDMVVFMSDGFTEARNAQGEFMPQSRIRYMVQRAAPLGCQNVVDRLKDLQRNWTGCADGVEDDSTVLAVRFEG